MEDVNTLNVICKDCGTIFELTADNLAFFEGRGLQPPKRCGKCRAAKRLRNELRDQGIR